MVVVYVLWCLTPLSTVLLVGETGVPGENYPLVASHSQTLSHNVISSTPCHEQGLNPQF